MGITHGARCRSEKLSEQEQEQRGITNNFHDCHDKWSLDADWERGAGGVFSGLAWDLALGRRREGAFASLELAETC